MLTLLKSRSTVSEATIFGQAIHALVDDGDSLNDISSSSVHIRPADPNLEDVFVTIARAQKNGLA